MLSSELPYFPRLWTLGVVSLCQQGACDLQAILSPGMACLALSWPSLVTWESQSPSRGPVISTVLWDQEKYANPIIPPKYYCHPQFTAEKAKTGNMACPRSQVLLTLMPADSSGRGSSDWAFPCPQRPAQVPAQGGRCLFRVVWMGQPVYRLLQAGTRSRLLHPLFPSLWS